MQALRSDLNIPTHLLELFNPPCSIRNVSVFRNEPHAQDAGAHAKDPTRESRKLYHGRGSLILMFSSIFRN